MQGGMKASGSARRVGVRNMVVINRAGTRSGGSMPSARRQSPRRFSRRRRLVTVRASQRLERVVATPRSFRALAIA